jgi:hypothetical protein
MLSLLVFFVTGGVNEINFTYYIGDILIFTNNITDDLNIYFLDCS